MHQVIALDLSRIAQDLQIRKTQVESVVQLLDEGNTIPFIARYRKDRTGGLPEDLLRHIQMRVSFMRQLAERKQTVLNSIEVQGKLTEGLRAAIVSADTSKRVEDLYLPYKPKKRSPASSAREKGLEPLALAIWNRDPAVANLGEQWSTFVNPEKELRQVEEVRTGVLLILAEWVAETADVRAVTRSLVWETGRICSSKSEKLGDGQGMEYKDYFNFNETLRYVPPHRILALNRGEKDNVIKTRFELKPDIIRNAAIKALAEHKLNGAAANKANGESDGQSPPAQTAEGELLCQGVPYATPHAELLRAAADDALTRLILPSLEREIRRELAEEAEAHAVSVFSRNLRSLLLQPPVHGRRVLAVASVFRSTCKVVAIDEHGNHLEDAVIHPHPPRVREKKHQRDKQSTLPESPPPIPPSEPVSDSPPSNYVVTQPAPEEIVEASGSVTSVCLAPTAVATVNEVSAASITEPSANQPSAAGDAPQGSAMAVAEAPSPAAVALAKREEAKAILQEVICRHNLNVIAIGNGPACRQMEELISELVREKLPDLSYAIVHEAGAAVYSASPLGREELPNHESTVRSTISIGRRLQDPLSELVKVEPHTIGVGLYQHDVEPRQLRSCLESVTESCVNQVGVDLNRAGIALLRHVSGLNQMVARDIVEYRKQHGPFRTREQLLHCPSVGPIRFAQAAGFIKISDGDNLLDRTWIHPECYGIVARLLSELGFGPDALADKAREAELQEKLKAVNIEEMSARLQVSMLTVRDIVEALLRPGRDPREDLPLPVFKKGILKIEDLKPGMELRGTVLNVVDFGVFVDVGLKDSGLVHISQLVNRYVKSPYDVVAVSDVVTVWVLTVDVERYRVSLTMIKPGTDRKPSEKRPHAPRPQQAPGNRSEAPPRHQDRQSGPRPDQSGPRPDQRGPRPAGRQGGGPPQRRGQGGRRQGPPSQREPAPAAQSQATNQPPPSKQPPPQRKGRRDPPRPKLSQAALEGRAPLRTFAELGALFAAKKTPTPSEPPAAHVVEPAPPPAAPPAQAAPETPATEQAATMEAPPAADSPPQ